jgi:hypothetical protein
MNFPRAIAIVALLTCSSGLQASITYNYTGGLATGAFFSFAPDPMVIASVTFADPLGPDASATDTGPGLVPLFWSMEGRPSSAGSGTLSIQTDATGQITVWDLRLSVFDPITDVTHVFITNQLGDVDEDIQSNGNVLGELLRVGTWTSSANAVSAPEPSTWLSVGFGCLAALASRRKYQPPSL